MNPIRELLTKLGFEVDHKPLNRAEKALEGIKSRLEFLAGAEIARSLFEMGKSFAEMGEKLAVASQSAGISVEEFQKLSFAAEQSAVSSDEMETAMARLSKKLYEAKHGSGEAAKAFQAVGLTGDQVSGFRTSQDALLALSDRFKGIQDPVKKAALAQELMGRGSIHMVGFLSKGSQAIKAQGTEAEKLGLILGGSQVEALEKMQLSFHKLYALFRVVGGYIAAYIAPVFSYLVDDFLRFFKVNKDVIGVNIRGFLNSFAYGLGFVWGALKLVITALIDMAKRFHIDGSMLTMIAKFAGLVSSILVMVKVLKFFAAAWALVSSPIFLTAAAIAAVVVALHDLYALFTGGQTWLGPALKSITGGGIGEHLTNFKNAFMGGGAEPAGGMYGAMSGFPAATLGATQGNSVTTTTSSVTAPVTIHAAGANPKEVGEKVREGVRDHLDRVKREAGRSTLSPVAY